MDKTLSKNLEERELKEIDAILPSLLQEGLITDIECRLIVGYNHLVEKQGAVYKVITSKTKEEAAHLFEIFRTLTVTIHAGELSKQKTSDCKDEEENNLPLDKPNPLLIDKVLGCLFGYLPLGDIKHSRFVCRKWNSAAEIFLRKRCTIHFHNDPDHGLKPHTFMKISKFSLPDLPFPAYKFSDDEYKWSINVIEDFFDKWGKNIKEVEFDTIILYDELPTASSSYLKNYDVTPWIAKASNLCSLKIKSAKHKYAPVTIFNISIDKLTMLKTVFLNHCRILTNGERVIFLPFSNVSLINVSFKRLGNVKVIIHDFCYNNIFDFSQTANLVLSNEGQENVEFDMEGQIFNKNQLNLRYLTLKHWETAKGDVNVLRLSGCNFTERSQLKIKNLLLDNLEVDLSVLPQTLEKISFGEEVNIVCEESFQLPNLKYLLLKAEDDNLRMLAYFENCPHLVELDLVAKAQEISGLTLDLDCIPRSVQKLRIDGGMKFDFANLDEVLEIDTLLLENVNDFSNCKKIVKNFQPKVLVLRYYKWTLPLDPYDGMIIMLANKQIGTIVIGTNEEDVDLHEKIPFEGSIFSKYFDKKSNYYKFENQVFQAIEREEYERISHIENISEDLHGATGLGDLFEYFRNITIY